MLFSKIIKETFKMSVENEIGSYGPKTAPAAPAAPSVDARIGGAQQQPQQQFNDRAMAPSFAGLMNNHADYMYLSDAARNYVEQIKQVLAQPSKDHDEIKVYQLTKPRSSLAFVCQDKAVVLMFSEACRDTILPGQPVIKAGASAKEAVASEIGANITIIKYLLVIPADYVKPLQMANHIAEQLTAATNPQRSRLTLESFDNRKQMSAEDKLVFSCQADSLTWTSIHDRYDPHGVLPRADYKFVVRADRKRTDFRSNNLYDMNAVQQQNVIAAVSVYTDFIYEGERLNPQTNAMEPRYRPVVHISDITMPLMANALLFVVLGLSLKHLIIEQKWKVPFTVFGGKGAPNVGNLLTDPKTHAPIQLESLEQMNNFINQYCSDANGKVSPVFAIDYQEGHAAPLHLEKFVVPGAHGSLLRDSADFLLADGSAVNPADPAQAPTVNIITRYTGVINGHGSVWDDSRNIDYLKEVAVRPADADKIGKLLHLWKREEDRLNVDRELHPELEIYYDLIVCAIMPNYMRSIFTGVSNAIETIVGEIDGGILSPEGLPTMQDFGNYNAASFTNYNFYGANGALYQYH